MKAMMETSDGNMKITKKLKARMRLKSTMMGMGMGMEMEMFVIPDFQDPGEFDSAKFPHLFFERFFPSVTLHNLNGRQTFTHDLYAFI